MTTALPFPFPRRPSAPRHRGQRSNSKQQFQKPFTEIDPMTFRKPRTQRIITRTASSLRAISGVLQTLAADLEATDARETRADPSRRHRKTVARKR